MTSWMLLIKTQSKKVGLSKLTNPRPKSPSDPSCGLATWATIALIVESSAAFTSELV